MVRYAGIKHDQICAISHELFDSSELTILEVPKELDDVPSKELILNGRVKHGSIRYKFNKVPAKSLRVAFVSNWAQECGLSTFSSFLFPEIAKHVGQFKLFIEQNEKSTGNIHQFGDRILDESDIAQCWKRGEELSDLIYELKEYDPDIILINHEFGIFPKATAWLSMLTQLFDYRTIVIQHSIFPHHHDKLIVEAAMKEVVVHLEEARYNLKEEKKISAKVHVIPHGCYEFNEEKLWNFYKTEHTFIQAGFLFQYKNWSDSLRAVALLKNKYPDVFFTGIMSESPHAKVEHQIYYKELETLIKELGIENNVGLIRGFQSDEVVDAFFRTNKVAVFPYSSDPQSVVYGASGMARLAMSKCLPVITSTGHHFSDLPTIKADGAENIAKELDILFSDWKTPIAQVKKQIEFMKENSWEKAALQYINIFENP